jgi:RNA polymerase sigma factor (sigma-70 family)
MTSVDKHHLRELLQRALRGDESAWNDFFREIRRFLHAELNKWEQNGNAHVGRSDVVQSALLRIWERIEGQFPDGPEDTAIRRFLAWVSKIARNRWVDEWRRIISGAQGAGSAIEHIPDPRPRKNAVNRDGAAIDVAAALAKLPEKQRQVVELYWFDHLSDAEISKRLDCSQGSVRVIRFRALEKLRLPELQSHLEATHDGR